MTLRVALWRAAAGASLGFGASGCLSVPSMHPGFPLTEGDELYGAGIGAAMLQTAVAPAWLQAAAAAGTPLDFGHLHLSYRRGLSESSEFGIQTLSFVAYGADYRWTAIEAGRFTVSTGAGASVFLPLVVPVYYMEVWAPLSLTVQPSPPVAITLSLRPSANVLGGRVRQTRVGRYRDDAAPEFGFAATLTTGVRWRGVELVGEVGLSRDGYAWIGGGIARRRRRLR